MISHTAGFCPISVKFSPSQDLCLLVTGDEINSDGGRVTFLDFHEIVPITLSFGTKCRIGDSTWSASPPNLIFLAAEDGAAHIFDLSSDDFHIPIQSFVEHDSATSSIDWNSHKNSIITASSDGTVKQWSIDRQQSIQTYRHEDAVRCAKWSPTDNGLFAAATANGKLCLWDSRGHDCNVFDVDDTEIISCDWSRLGTTVATISLNTDYVKVWDFRHEKDPTHVLHWISEECLNKVKFSPHSDREFAACTTEGNVVFWDYGKSKHKLICFYQPHDDTVLDFDIDNRYDRWLASCSVDGCVRLWEHQYLYD